MIHSDVCFFFLLFIFFFLLLLFLFWLHARVDYYYLTQIILSHLHPLGVDIMLHLQPESSRGRARSRYAVSPGLLSGNLEHLSAHL